MLKYVVEPGENNAEYVEMTKEEIAQANKMQAEFEIEVVEIQRLQAVRESALAKLAALGLSADEIAAL